MVHFVTGFSNLCDDIQIVDFSMVAICGFLFELAVSCSLFYPSDYLPTAQYVLLTCQDGSVVQPSEIGAKIESWKSTVTVFRQDPKYLCIDYISI